MGIFENIPSFLHEELFFFSYHDWPIYNKIFCMKKYFFVALLVTVFLVWGFKRDIALTLIPIALKLSNPISENQEINWSIEESSEIATKPNIILILADDLGFNDVSFYNGGAADGSLMTPNIDNLAKEGVAFLNGYAASPVCSPSRAALLTGSYPMRTGVVGVLWPEGHGFGGKNGGKVGLHPNEVTISEVLKEKGYATAMAGKWHLGSKAPFLPTYQGFDTYFGIPYSNDMNREKLPIMLDEKVVEIKPDQSLLTKRYTDFAIDFINSKNDDEPFFVYLAHSMPHVPIFASDNFKGTSMGSVYGDVIEEIDHNVGRLISVLKEKNIYDNTIII